MDVVFHNLSDQLFDLILGIVYDYAVTTTRANAVRAFGSLISSLTRANPKKVIEKFLPQCAEQIRIELEHGASSIRTTSTGLAIPSDTSLHWRMSLITPSTSPLCVLTGYHADMAILRAIVSNDGSEVVFTSGSICSCSYVSPHSSSHTRLSYSTLSNCSCLERKTNVVLAALVTL